jgi:hypothetical protein
MRPRGALLVSACAALIAVGGCGGDDTAQQPSRSTTQGRGGEQMDDFVSCLREHGADIPEGERPKGAAPEGAPPEGGQPPQYGAPPGAQRDEKTQAAFEACRGELPDGAGPPGGEGSDEDPES